MKFLLIAICLVLGLLAASVETLVVLYLIEKKVENMAPNKVYCVNFPVELCFSKNTKK